MIRPRLGVNIDHVATIRNARGETYPDPARAAELAMAAGADGITAHLREDRRHISDADIEALAVREGRADAAALFEALRAGAIQARSLGLEVHAGHGLDFETVGPIAALPQVAELNIGHFLIGEAIFVGLDAAIRRMRALMDAARDGATARLGEAAA